MNRLYRDVVEARVQMALDSARAAAAYNHLGLRGRAREIFVTDMLTPMLAPTMGICSGVVIDGSDRQSGQTDVVVFDKRVVPPLLLETGNGIIPCESVLFAIEVKSELNSEELKKSIQWSRTLKGLAFHRGVAFMGSVSSVPCAVFAFGTDLAEGRTMEDEAARLHSAVSAANAPGAVPIKVPLSAVTVTTRGHTECVDTLEWEADAVPAKFQTFANPSAQPTAAGVRFIRWMIRNAAPLSPERAPISIDGYLE